MLGDFNPKQCFKRLMHLPAKTNCKCANLYTCTVHVHSASFLYTHVYAKKQKHSSVFTRISIKTRVVTSNEKNKKRQFLLWESRGKSISYWESWIFLGKVKDSPNSPKRGVPGIPDGNLGGPLPVGRGFRQTIPVASLMTTPSVLARGTKLSRSCYFFPTNSDNLFFFYPGQDYS